MARSDVKPVVRPLPVFIVKLGVGAFFIIGSILLWNDRRMDRTGMKVHKSEYRAVMVVGQEPRPAVVFPPRYLGDFHRLPPASP